MIPFAVSTDTLIQVLPQLGAAATFFWGIWVWRSNSKTEHNRAAAESLRFEKTRRIEATRPFLERQFQLYVETSQVVAVLVTPASDEQHNKARIRFEELYWSELALVEDQQVAGAMRDFRDALEQEQNLPNASLNLMKVLRASLDTAWGISAWSGEGERAKTA